MSRPMSMQNTKIMKSTKSTGLSKPPKSRSRGRGKTRGRGTYPIHALRESSKIGGNSMSTRSQGPLSPPLDSVSTGLASLASLSNQDQSPALATRAGVYAAMRSPHKAEQLPFTRVARAAA